MKFFFKNVTVYYHFYYNSSEIREKLFKIIIRPDMIGILYFMRNVYSSIDSL